MKTELTYWCFCQARLEPALQKWAAAVYDDEMRQQKASSPVLDFLRSRQALAAGLRKESKLEKDAA